MSEVTRIIEAAEAGDSHAADQLLPIVYDELRRLAAQRLSQERPGQTLQPTALVHEAFLRLVGVDSPQRWECRGHFFAAAAEAMRRILVENARRKLALKHGGNLIRNELDELDVPAPAAPERLLEVDAALAKLAQKDARKAQLVKLRFFSGLTIRQTAEVLGVAPSTADRDWAYAKAWLYREMSREDAAGSA